MAPSSSDPETTQTLARSILQKNLRVRPGENLVVEGWSHTLPWAVAIAREARRLKVHPMILYEDESAYWDSVEKGESKILGTKSDHEWAALAKTDVYIHMWGPGDRVRLAGLPPKKAGELVAWNAPWYVTARKAGLRGARLELGRPFPTLATAYGVEESAWRDQIIEATLVDPVSLAKAAQPIVRALEKGRELRIRHENGTDLTLGLRGFKPRAATGRLAPSDMKLPFGMLMNLPAGAIRVALDDSVADGTIVGNRTCYFEDGVAKEAVFDFSKGKLTEARFGSGGERFHKPFAKASAGKDRPGMLGIGLNPKLHDTPQVEDVEAGAIMVSVGGNAFIGGKNKSNFFGWAIAQGAQVEVDGKRLPIPG